VNRTHEDQEPTAGNLYGRADDGEVADASARKQAFLLVERHRNELRDKCHDGGGSYEDMCLLTMVTHLQRDCLFESDRPAPFAERSHLERLEQSGLAGWARPWASSCLVELDSDLARSGADLKRSRRWLSARIRGESETTANKRFVAIVAAVSSNLRAEGLGSSPPASGDSSEPARLNLNGATADELRALKLSVTQTFRVLRHRERWGGFGSIDELDDLPGFSRALRDELKQKVTV
jgi:DNA uptake protein ComE-like DNA-binding protein